MYIVRDIFHLRFGEYKNAKALLDEAYSKGMCRMQNHRECYLILPATLTG
jgi:hypothetical protein